MTQTMGTHAAGTPTDSVADLLGEWHIGTGWPGMFPQAEASCGCPKAPCGLVIPDPDLVCEYHHGDKTIRQAHEKSHCPNRRRWKWLP